VYRWLDHTGEMELEIDAPDEPTVLAEAVAALRELVEDGPGGRPESRRLTLQAPDRAALLAAFLTELLFLAETEKFVATELTRAAIGGGDLDAEVKGYVGRPSALVKAVTYHRLRFDCGAGGCHAGAVLDV
jgi:SHS2 domain-containing protein